MSSLADQHVLVTGGGGFVGAPTVRALLEQGADVMVRNAEGRTVALQAKADGNKALLKLLT